MDYFDFTVQQLHLWLSLVFTDVHPYAYLTNFNIFRLTSVPHPFNRSTTILLMELLPTHHHFSRVAHSLFPYFCCFSGSPIRFIFRYFRHLLTQVHHSCSFCWISHFLHTVLCKLYSNTFSADQSFHSSVLDVHCTTLIIYDNTRSTSIESQVFFYIKQIGSLKKKKTLCSQPDLTIT